MFFTFPEDAHWNPDRMAVEFGVEIGEYRGVVRVSRRVFPYLFSFADPRKLRGSPSSSPDGLELIAEREVRRRQLTDDENVEITGRDLREREPRASVHVRGAELLRSRMGIPGRDDN